MFFNYVLKAFIIDGLNHQLCSTKYRYFEKYKSLQILQASDLKHAILAMTLSDLGFYYQEKHSNIKRQK